MITERDLRAHAAEWARRDDVVEKDYVLGWILAGTGTEPALSDGWVFNGGTCLKRNPQQHAVTHETTTSISLHFYKL